MYYILYNPLSKNGKNQKRIAKLEEKIHKQGEETKLMDIVEVGNNLNDFVELVHRTDTVIIIGGDGTLHHVVCRVRGLELNGIKVYLYRGGNGNDFGREFKGKLVDISNIIQNVPNYQSIDVDGKVTDEMFLNCTGMGIDGVTCAMVDGNKSKRKGLNYFKNAIKGFKSFDRYNLEVEVDGVKHHFKKVWFATVMNGKYFGGGMKLSPKSNRFDDEMELYVVHSMGLARLISIFPLIFIGKHLWFRNAGIDVLKGKEFHLVADKPQTLESDGEVLQNIKEIKIKR